ncbi:MAG: hypothetical protein KAJ19_27225, partial [Gammaproteobacteria bacterium]|nr:hypothetical protein [Gammaproteobacteria bacterium]
MSLKKISGINPNLGLSIIDSAAQDVLSLFTPEWLVESNLDNNYLSEKIKSNLSDLELVWVIGHDSSNLEFLYDLPSLNTLIIQELDSSRFSEFQFDELKGLRSLSIISSEIYDLSSLGTMPKLKDLNLIGCWDLEEIGTLVDFMELKSVGFPGCEDIMDVSVIEELPALNRLSLPPNTSQEEFSNIIDTLRSLQVLELLEMDSIVDLSPLSGYVGLRALILGTGFTDLTPLYQLKDLELLILEENYFDDSLNVAEIQNALPETKIVQGGGFCLGSGWILLLIPAVLLFVLFKSGHNKYKLSGAKQ